MLQPLEVRPWQMPDRTKPLRMQDKAAFQHHLIDHLANFDVDSPMSPCLLTSIACTIGPSSSDPETLMGMMEKGMSIARLDMRVGSLDDHKRRLEAVRSSCSTYGVRNQLVLPLAIALDLKGTEILTGKLMEGEKIQLTAGEVITLTSHPAWDDKGTRDKLFVDYKELPGIVKPKERILLDFGRIELLVRGTVDSDIVCEILNDGTLGNYKNVSLPGIPLNLPSLTKKDRDDIRFAVEQEVDAIFVSFVRDRHGLVEAREALGERGRSIMVFAKIDTKVAYENFDDILGAADGIVINRGAMSIEMSTEKVLQAQRAIFAKCNKVGKPVFSMTDILNSMVHQSCPSIPEVTDVASTVVDGADALILTDATSNGDQPQLTVHTLATICREAEAQVWAHELFMSLNLAAVPPVDPSHAISIAAVEASLKCHASAILIVTTSGQSAQLVARYRPRCPIIALTRYSSVARRLNMWRGVLPILYIFPPQPTWMEEVDTRLEYGIEVGKRLRAVKTGDPLVLINGWRQGAGFTNTFRIVYASSSDGFINPGAKGRAEKKMCQQHPQMEHNQ